jgi:hypothetical protein
VIPNARLCKALLDRITDRVHIIETGADSFRFRRTVEKGRTKSLFTIYQISDSRRMSRQKYPSDLSREQFQQILPLLESVRKRTKPRTVDLYEVFCAVLYLLKSGCQWRMLPRDFPKWRTVHSYFAKWSEPDQHGVSVLERALKKSGWRGPYPTGTQRHDQLLDR